MLFTLTSANDSMTGAEAADSFTTTSTNFSATDTLTGGAGIDVLSFTNRASLLSTTFAHTTGIDAIRFSSTGNTVALGDDVVAASDTGSVELTHSSFSITSLDTSLVSSTHNVVVGGTGAVTLANNAGNRVVAKSAVNVSITGGVGSDTILGSTGNDKINGGSGNDLLSGGGGMDNINGGSGDDTISSTEETLNSRVSIIGGAGTDTLLFTNAAAISNTDLTNVSGVEIIAFSANGNTTVLTDANVANAGNNLELANGAFTITSLNSSAVHSPHNVIIGGTGTVTLANAANRVLSKDGVNTVIVGGTGNDTILGGTGNDLLSGGRGNDSINAGSGNDTVSALDIDLNISDKLAGGVGTDTLRYLNQASISSTDLSNVTGFEIIEFTTNGNSAILSDAAVLNAGGTLELDNNDVTITSLNSSAVLSTHNVVIGGTGAVTLANGVNNRVTAKDGVNSAITGGTGNDTILGGTGDDYLSSGTGNDSINAGAGADTIIAAGSTTTVIGGDGTDTLRYTSAVSLTSSALANVSGVETIEFTVSGNSVVLSDANVSNAGGALELLNNGFTITALDSSAVLSTHNVVVNGTGLVTLGNNGNRILTKDGVNSSILGGSGNDTIIGGSGNDSFNPGAGADSISGGSGNDTITGDNLDSLDSISGGVGTDTLLFTTAANLSAAAFTNISGIDVISFSADNNVIALNSTAFVPDSNSLELSNDTHSITSLDSSAVLSNSVIISGTGAVTLANNAGNKVTAKDGVNTSITGGTGSDTINGGTGADRLNGGAGSDSITAGSGNDTIVSASANLDSNDTLIGGDGTDTLLISDAATIDAADLSHVTGIEVLQFSADGNNIVLTDSYVNSLTGHSLELNNGTFTISSLNSSAVSDANTIVVNGTGAVTLASGVNNHITTKDGVNSTILCGTGNDTITSGTGSDSLVGGAGNNTFINITANDTVIGGDGIDSLIFTSGTPITSDILAHVSGIEKIYVSADITNLVLSEAFVDSAFNETVELNTGTYNVFNLDSSAVHSAVIVNGTGNITLNNNSGNKVTAQDGVNTNITGGSGNDTLISGTGSDNLSGGAGDDNFTDITEDDSISGGTGTDTLIFTEAASVTVGLLANVTGVDVISFGANGNSIELNDSFVSSSDAGTVELANSSFTITSLNSAAVLSTHNVIIGGTGAVTLANNAGNRVVAKDGVNTSITGGTGNDTIIGGTGDDSFDGGTGSDSLSGGAGNDSFIDVSAGDTISGGIGTDTLLYSSAATLTSLTFANVTGIDAILFNADGNNVVLNNGFISNSDAGRLELNNGTHTITSLDSSGVTSSYAIAIGGTGAVTLADNAGNKVTAKDGVNTSIIGGAGADTIISGTGNDNLSGGAGADSFLSITASDTINGGTGTDTLLFSTVATLSSSSFATISGIEIVQFGANGNSIALNDSALASSDTGKLQIANSIYSITSLDSSAVTSAHDVVISGTGAVTLANNAGNRVVADDGINTSIIGGTGNDSFVGGTGNDSFVGGAGDDVFSTVSSSDTIDGGLGTDNIAFSSAVTDNTLLTHVTNIESLTLGTDGNSLVISDALAGGSITGILTLDNDTHTIISLDSSAVSSSHNVMIAGTGAVTLADNAGNQVISKDGVNTSITGGSGADTITSGTGSDALSGGAGNDIFVNSSSNDTIDGGAGTDILLFNTSATINDATFTHISNVESFQFGTGGNSLVLTDNILTHLNVINLELNNGSFTIVSLDSSAVSDTHDVIIAGTGEVTLANNAGNALVTKDGVNTHINGGTGDDIISNGTGNDVLNGGEGDDTISGLNAGDSIHGDEGKDTLQIAAGTTLTAASFANITGIDIVELTGDGSSLALSDAFVSGSDAQSIELKNDGFTIASLNTSAVSRDYEVLVTGTGTVTLADGAANRIIASDDIDASIQGGTGNDTIIGGAGADSLSGGTGNDSISSSSGNDVITTLDASLTISDSINGGSGSDILLFSDVAQISNTDLKNVRNVETIAFSVDGNSINLSDANVSNAGGTLTLDNGSHTITSLNTSSIGSARTVEIGGTGAVTLADNAGNRVFAKEAIDSSIIGGSGNDTIIGSTGNDAMKGGAGVDILTGDAGSDHFILSALTDSTATATDRITDFVQGDDVIVLSGLGFTDIQSGSGSDTVLGFTNNGASTTISNAAGTFHIELTGVYAALTAADFTFV